MQRRLRRLRPKLRQTPCNTSPELIVRAFTALRSVVAFCMWRYGSRCSGLAAAGALGLFAATPVFASPGNGDVAEFIVNFVRYTAWSPDSARKMIAVCYAHGGALPTSAMAIEQPVTVKGYPLTWRPISLPNQLAGCDVLWLNADVRPAPREWLSAISDKPVLTISNYADFTADGGIVGAYRLGNDWRFEVNLEALQRARINIAAAALRLSQKPKPVVAGETR